MMSRAALSLYLFSFIGIVQLWGRTVIDGTLLNLFSALHGPAPYLLPGTQTPLRSTFTGIFPIDYLLRVLVVFFWEVADGSHPSSSAIGLYFLGQYFSVLVMFYLENVRHGTGSGLLRLVSSPRPCCPRILTCCNPDRHSGCFFSKQLGSDVPGHFGLYRISDIFRAVAGITCSRRNYSACPSFHLMSLSCSLPPLLLATLRLPFQ